MKLTWYGHAAFLLETNGIRVILDPYRWPDAGGFLPIEERADLVVVSHENDRYHSHLGQIKPPFDVIRTLEIPQAGRTSHGLTFQGIHVFEDERRLPEDEVTMISFTVEGMRIAFLGDLGHALRPEELAPIQGSDIVIAATGGTPTIGLADLHDLIDQIGPKVIVPMHYKVEGKINLNILPIESFLEEMKGTRVEHISGSSYEFDKTTMPTERTIVSLQPAR
jgi:L-ascorbate metabolism protein UlaG (beta-lactamase superfamily)